MDLTAHILRQAASRAHRWALRYSRSLSYLRFLLGGFTLVYSSCHPSPETQLALARRVPTEIIEGVAKHTKPRTAALQSDVAALISLGEALFHANDWSQAKRSCSQCHVTSALSTGRGPVSDQYQQKDLSNLINLSDRIQFGSRSQYSSVSEVIAEMIVGESLQFADMLALYQHVKSQLIPPAPGDEPIATPQESARSFVGQTFTPEPIPHLFAAALASMSHPEFKDRILREQRLDLLLAGSHLKEAMQKFEGVAAENTPPLAPNWQKEVLNLAVQALSAYLLTIQDYDTDFDKFAQKLKADEPLATAFHPGFAEGEYTGLELFLASGCAQCHTGPHFTRGRSFNVGQQVKRYSESWEQFPIERLIALMGSATNPMRPYLVEHSCFFEPFKEQSQVLHHLACSPEANADPLGEIPSNIAALGAFATPSLRLLTRERVCSEGESAKEIQRYLQAHDQRSAQSKKSGIGMVSDQLPAQPLQDAQIEKLMLFLCSLQLD